IFDYDSKWHRLQVVNLELENPDLWNNPEQAQAISKEKKSLDDVVLVLDKLKNDLHDSQELLELIIDENDDDAFIALEKSIQQYSKVIEDFEFRRMFSNPADPLNCFLDIQAGAGGTEAQDWASMLLRQYLRYCEDKGFKAEILEESDGDVAGIKSATLKIEGEYAYGF